MSYFSVQKSTTVDLYTNSRKIGYVAMVPNWKEIEMNEALGSK
jgi:hypothetical protein